MHACMRCRGVMGTADGRDLSLYLSSLWEKRESGTGKNTSFLSCSTQSISFSLSLRIYLQDRIGKRKKDQHGAIDGQTLSLSLSLSLYDSQTLWLFLSLSPLSF